jgi:hypothetical protein
MFSESAAMPTNPALRYEVKMSCDAAYLPDVHAWLRLHYEGFREAYPARRINNLYLDTLDYDCLYDNLNGVAQRAKLRLRWYGEVLERAEGVLELKGKVAQQGWKRSSAPVVLDLRSGAWADLLTALRAQTEGLFDVWLGALAQPVLINHYRRAYYESADHALRATIDWQQVAYEQMAWPRPNLDAPSLDDHQIVVEIKADGAAHQRVSDLLTRFPLRTERHSKYVGSVLSALS